MPTTATLRLGYLDDSGYNKVPDPGLQTVGKNLHGLWGPGLIKFVSDDPEVWVTRLSSKPLSARVSIIDPVCLAGKFGRIVATPGFYPGRKVEASKFTVGRR